MEKNMKKIFIFMFVSRVAYDVFEKELSLI